MSEDMYGPFDLLAEFTEGQIATELTGDNLAGPANLFFKFAKSSDTGKGLFANRESQLTPKFEALGRIPRLSWLSRSWPTLRALLLMLEGPDAIPRDMCPQDFFNQTLELIGLATHDVDRQISFTPLPPSEHREYDLTRAWLKETWHFSTPPESWTANEWRLFGLIDDIMAIGVDRTRVPGTIERVSVVLAAPTGNHATSYCSLTIAVERCPGPSGLISPHWWKLGLAPLGDGCCLIDTIHTQLGEAFAHLHNDASTRDQLRWWIETTTKSFPQRIEEIPSHETAIACLGLVVLDRKYDSFRPAIDSRIVVSAKQAKLSNANFMSREIEQVAHHKEKIEAVLRGGYSHIVFASKGMPAEYAVHPSVKTFARFRDVFENILLTSEKTRAYKVGTVDKWCKPKTKSNGQAWVEVYTHEAFIEASEEKGTNSDQELREDQLFEDNTLSSDADLAEYHPLTLDQIYDANENDERLHFLVGQPVFQAKLQPNAVSLGLLAWDELWDLAEKDEDPSLEVENSASELRRRGSWYWGEIQRADMIKLAISDDPFYRHICVVCGAGVGKTTNLEWLEMAVNRIHFGWGRHIAIRMTVDELGNARSKNQTIKRIVAQKLVPLDESASEREIFTAERLIESGSVTFLLDSLDQANPNPGSRDLLAIAALIEACPNCRVWLSGRPYAFSIAGKSNSDEAVGLRNMKQCDWLFLRIGELREPEARQLLETAGRR